jgi:tRNA nucleotidyltransferase/poly(A) polymerase
MLAMRDLLTLTSADRKLLSAFGPDVYAIGGRVRDSLFNRYHGTTYDQKDADYVLTGNTLESAREKLARLGRIDAVGESFAVLKVQIDGETVDIALPRRETSTGQGHRDFEMDFGPEVTIAEDRSRRDFTMNAVSYRLVDGMLDYVPEALEDIQKRRLRVINEQAFVDDPLRMVRAVQFAARFDLAVESTTRDAMIANSYRVRSVAPERLSEELTKLLTKSKRPSIGLRLAEETGVLSCVIPELVEGVGCDQNRYHKYDVFRNNLEACDHAKPTLLNRMTALMHDVGKPMVRERNGVDGEYSFWGHETEGAALAKAILNRLRFPTEVADTVSHLTQHHMYVADPHMSPATIRRFVQRVGVDHLEQLFDLRCDDVHGHGMSVSYERNDAFEQRVFEIVREQPALSVRDLAIDGIDVIQTLVEVGARSPGYRGDRAVGDVLKSLLDEVLEVPERNSAEFLSTRAIELARAVHQRESLQLAPNSPGWGLA